MSFNIPIKQLIVNSDDQARLLEDDGTVYLDGDCTPSAGGFIIEGFTPKILGSELVELSSAVRIIKTAASAAVAAVKTFTVSATAADAGDIFKIRYQSLNHEEVQMQQHPLEKIYQLSADQTTANGIAANIAAVINADPHAPVTATVSTNVVTLTAKKTGVDFNVYSEDIAGAQAVTTPAALAVGTYDQIKVEQWPVNHELDRNEEYYPRKGVNYARYYFKWQKQNTVSNDMHHPNAGKIDAISEFELWVAAGTTLATKLDLLVGDVNV